MSMQQFTTTRIAFNLSMSVLLSVWCIGNLIDGLHVTALYEYVGGFLTVVLIPSIALIFLSYMSLKDNAPTWLIILSRASMCVGVGSLLWGSIQTAYIFSIQ